MNKVSKSLFEREKYLFLLLIWGILLSLFPVFESQTWGVRNDKIEGVYGEASERLATIEGNSLLPMANLITPDSQSRKMKVIVTGYSSTEGQTDSDPFITAAGAWVREGIVANNLLPFGTRVKIPELYGDKVFVVEDRMHWRKGYYHVDIWFPSYWEALNFGAKRTYIEILES